MIDTLLLIGFLVAVGAVDLGVAIMTPEDRYGSPIRQACGSVCDR